MMRGRHAGTMAVVWTGLALLLGAFSGCAGGSDAPSANPLPGHRSSRPSGSGSDQVSTGASSTPAKAIDPTRFGAAIDNPFLPFLPGTRWRYRGSSDKGVQVETVTVTRQTKRILGVATVVVHDVATSGGEVVEDTFDWYAQDRAGNVWYFGEDTKTLRDGQVTSREGSWQAGTRGAEPGIVMEAHPRVGDRYQQEFYAGHAQDRAEVLSTSAITTVPLGAFRSLVETKDSSPLEPAVVEHKYFARGIGSIREVDVRGGSDQIELVSIRRP